MRICVLFVLLQLLFLKHVSSKLRWSSMMQNIIRSGTQKLHVRSNTMFPPFTKWSASLHLQTFSTTNLYLFCLQKRKKQANKPLESNRVKTTPNYTRHRPHIAWKGIINFPQFVTNWFKYTYVVLQRYTGSSAFLTTTGGLTECPCRCFCPSKKRLSRRRGWSNGVTGFWRMLGVDGEFPLWVSLPRWNHHEIWWDIVQDIMRSSHEIFITDKLHKLHSTAVTNLDEND